MGNISVYLPDELESKVKAASEDLNVSRICQDALSRELNGIAARQKSEKGLRYERVEIEVEQGGNWITKAFEGAQLVDQFKTGRHRWDVYLTRRGHFAFYRSAKDEGELHVFPSLDEAERKGMPDDLLAAVAAALGQQRTVELDI